MSTHANASDVTRLLHEAASGDHAAMDEAMRRLYQSLRSLAVSQINHERPGAMLSATMLVNEAWLQVFADATPPEWQSRQHLLAVSARAMRQVLIDYARRRKAAKRPQDEDRIQLAELTSSLGADLEPDDLEAALERLARLDPRQARIVDMRFFAGLTGEQIAAATNLSTATVQREWRMARAWLQRELGAADGPTMRR